MIITRGLSQSQRIITQGYGRYSTISKILCEIFVFTSNITKTIIFEAKLWQTKENK